MEKIYRTYYRSPLGPVEIAGTQDYICTVSFLENSPIEDAHLPSVVKDCRKQVAEYFEGKRRIFSLPLLTEGTDFQKKVWEQLQHIPYGKTISYRQLSDFIGVESASRAVGAANGKNPIGLLIPCHRVIGANGSLTGYAGGLARKKWLIEFEQKQTGRLLTLF